MKTNRRELLKKGLLSTTAFLALPVLVEAKTPPQPEGPFYPVVDQVDKDADLIQVQGATQIAAGEIVIVQGILTDLQNTPVSGALVEIWQACHTGKYNHPSDPNEAPLDPNFQYWGKAVTNEKGEYRFRTIIPGAYQASEDWIRPPHIHFRIAKRGYLELITQMYFAGDKLNEKDLYLKRLSPADKKKLVIEFTQQQNLAHPVGQFNIQIERL